MGMRENWTLFVESTKAKGESHEKVAQYWDSIHNFLSLFLILLSAVTTVLAALDGIPDLVIVTVSGVTTMVSTVSGFLQPHKHKQIQGDAAKEFKTLTMRMIRCETEKEYEELWKELNKQLLNEPFLPSKYKVKVDQDYSVTPELMKLMQEKQVGIECGKDEVEENCNELTPLIK